MKRKLLVVICVHGKEKPLWEEIAHFESRFKQSGVACL